MFGAAVAAAIILRPGEPVCVGENSGTLNEEKLETGDLVLMYREVAWGSPYISPVYVVNMKAQVLSRVALKSEDRGQSAFDYVLEQRRLTPDESRSLRDLLIAEGIHEWPEYINPKDIWDGFQWSFETWEDGQRLQMTTFDNVEPHCARAVLRAMSDLLQTPDSRVNFQTDAFGNGQTQSIEALLRSADSLIEVEPSPSSGGVVHVDAGAESAVSLRRIISVEGTMSGAILTMDETLLVTTEGREWPLPHGDLFGVVSPYYADSTIHFVIDGTIDNGVEIVLRESAEGWVGELMHLSDAGITVLGEVRLESIN